MPTEKEIDSFIREKCVEANDNLPIKLPELCSAHRPDGDHTECHICGILPIVRIQLADILLALENTVTTFSMEGSPAQIGWARYERGERVFYDEEWNLKLPYHAQTLETKQFIYQLLKP